jgi:hypothetical protein
MVEGSRVSLERGTRSGVPRTDGPQDSGVRIAIAAVLVGAALLLAIGLGLGALMPRATPSASPTLEAPSPTPSVSPSPPASPPPSSSPEPSATPAASATAAPSATPEPSATPAASATPAPTITPTPAPTRTLRPTPPSTRSPEPTAIGDDPTDLPRFPGARLEERQQGRDGDLATLELEYRTPARLDRVRRHYRVMLRRHGWFVGDVEFDDDAWEIAANKGSREASIELKHDGGGTKVEVDISWPADDRDRRSGGPGGGHSGPGG